MWCTNHHDLPRSMLSFANSRTCIIALLRSSLAAHQQLHQHQHSLQFQPRFAATASGFHASLRSYDASFATSIRFAANLRSPPLPLTPLSRLRCRAASKNCAAISNRFTASLGLPSAPARSTSHRSAASRRFRASLRFATSSTNAASTPQNQRDAPSLPDAPTHHHHIPSPTQP